MGRRVKTELKSKKARALALDPESRENQLIAQAYNLVEQRLLDGTATSQETVHFLRLGSQKKKLEEEYLQSQIALNKAKIESLKASQRTEELYANALNAMREYSGNNIVRDYDHTRNYDPE